MESIVLALADAVHTGDATGIVDFMVLDINAGSLADALTLTAVAAFVDIDDRAEERETGDQTEDGAYGADRVAPGAATAKRQEADDEERSNGDDERGTALHPDIDMVEAVALSPLSDASKDVVNPEIERLKQVSGDTAVSAVRGNKDGDGVKAQKHQEDKDAEQGVAQPAVFTDIMEAVLFHLAGQIVEAVLHDAQGADHRAVDTTEEEREEEDGSDDDEASRHYSRQELNFGHPAEIEMKHTGEVEEEGGDAEKENDCEGGTDFTKHGTN